MENARASQAPRQGLTLGKTGKIERIELLLWGKQEAARQFLEAETERPPAEDIENPLIPYCRGAERK